MKISNLLKNPSAYVLKAFQITKNRFRTVFGKGDTVFCQICDWKGKTFFDEKCPNCYSLPRTRLVPYSLDYFHLIENESKILHIAPNINEFNYFKSKVTSLSNYDRLNIRNVPHINIVQDLTATTLDSDQYDLAIAWHVLEHIPKDTDAISEVYRLLKSGGRFLVSVPIYPDANTATFEDDTIDYNEFEKVHGHYDHCRSCGLDYYKRFESIGFKTQTLKVETLNDEDITYYGLRKNHVVWCFIK